MHDGSQQNLTPAYHYLSPGGVQASTLSWTVVSEGEDSTIFIYIYMNYVNRFE